MKASSQRWLERQRKDIYVKSAVGAGYRSRAVYKLMEIQEKFKVIKPGMRILDLGAAPGSWSQYATKVLNNTGLLIALDILPIVPLPNVDIITGDFNEDYIFELILHKLNNIKVDLILSDMSPNISGIRTVDQAKSLNLAEMALEMVYKALKLEGDFVIKLFQGYGEQEFIAKVRQSFKKVIIVKPKASRALSKEVYLVAKGYKL